jgi:hypothetical protein
MIKKMIIESGDRNLFPELNIPRTTINYWLTNSKEVVSSEKDYAYEFRIKKLKEELYLLKGKNLVATKCLKKLTKELGSFDQKSIENRKFVVETVQEFRRLLPVKEILNIVGISQTTYYRWRVEVYGCNNHELKKCKQVSPTQLTQEEQRKVVKYATDANFSKFSTLSLMHYCRRHNLLNISLESWYKYLKMYGVVRKNFHHKRKRYGVGIRANEVNEIWHIDITIIKYAENKKAYLQVMIDNYSRMIIA